ncbi:GNAT family N-acetyltransferase [Pedobacter lusitanus]|nr:GNAT family N-acetyltransferase [Pedobacter lusitanus]
MTGLKLPERNGVKDNFNDMLTVAKLLHISLTEIETLGHNGYLSDRIYKVSVERENNGYRFSVDQKLLAEPYLKTWTCSQSDILHYNELLIQQNSFGVYENNVLIGYAIAEQRDWNNTLYLESLLISQSYRGKGAGKLVIEKLIDHAIMQGYRLVQLETQNTNFYAIRFYEKCGFEITGINLELYDDTDHDETALYMSYRLK